MNLKGNRREIAIGLLGIGFGLVTLLVWIPSDIDTGVIDVWRRTVRIGDAMLPTFATIGMILAGITILIRSYLSSPSKDQRPINIVFLIWSVAIMAIGLTVMQITGLILAQLWFGGDKPYRLLLDTAPWKYFGFVLGGAFIILGFMSLTSHKITGRFVMISLIATILIALVYDVPFDNLLLPPNGDF